MRRFTGIPEKTLPNGETSPFIAMMKLAYFASTLSMAINSLNENGMYKKKPRKNDTAKKPIFEATRGKYRTRSPATTDATSHSSERERWKESETQPHHSVPKMPPISIQLMAAELSLRESSRRALRSDRRVVENSREQKQSPVGENTLVHCALCEKRGEKGR